VERSPPEVAAGSCVQPEKPRKIAKVTAEFLKNHPKRWKWRLEWFAQTAIEKAISGLPGPWVFRLGEVLGGWAWFFMKQRRRVVLRNLRIALHGEFDLAALEKMTQQSFRRTGANLLSAVRTVGLSPAEVDAILAVENPELIATALAASKGLVLMPPHMGNWEILSRMKRLFAGTQEIGAFYRPLNNPLLDARVLAQRESDGTRLFSKRDNFHQVTSFIREGGVVGILADQRVGTQGEVVRFFGRLTRASPLPSLMARRSKSPIFAMSLSTVAAGKWQVRYHPVEGGVSTTSCMQALEQAMKASPLDVFWLQDRWKVYFDHGWTIRDWLGTAEHGEGTRHRALIWLIGVTDFHKIPAAWQHHDVDYEVVLAAGQVLPAGISAALPQHRIGGSTERKMLQRVLREIDSKQLLPVDYLLCFQPTKALEKACRREGIPLAPQKIEA
jgi:Kdo2-lipid IVA lauroyltransferase/acyltransferase